MATRTADWKLIGFVNVAMGAVHFADAASDVLLGRIAGDRAASNPFASGGVWKGKKNKNDHHPAEGEQHGPGPDD